MLQVDNGMSSVIPITANTPVTIHFSGTIKMGASGGDLIFRWAQNSTSTNATTVMEGSYFRAVDID